MHKKKLKISAGSGQLFLVQIFNVDYRQFFFSPGHHLLEGLLKWGKRSTNPDFGKCFRNVSVTQNCPECFIPNHFYLPKLKAYHLSSLDY